MFVTVAICTFRRAALLPTTLASFAQMDRPDVPWELVLVDNASEPAVRAVAEQWVGQLPVRYVAEAEVGIARARNRAVVSAAAPRVLFCDDDVQFDRSWLVRMVAAMQGHDDCAFWGGRIEPVWPAEMPRPPAWFDLTHCPMLGDAIVRYDAGPTPRYFDPVADHPFYTCNLGLKVEAVRQAGMFDVTLGHQGKTRGTGEDSWMVRSICQQGGRGWYAADALLHHPVPPERLTKPFARGFVWRQGRISVEMLRRSTPGGQTPRWLYRLAAGQLVGGAGTFLRGVVGGGAGRRFAGEALVRYNVSKLWHAMRGQ